MTVNGDRAGGLDSGNTVGEDREWIAQAGVTGHDRPRLPGDQVVWVAGLASPSAPVRLGRDTAGGGDPRVGVPATRLALAPAGSPAARHHGRSVAEG